MLKFTKEELQNAPEKYFGYDESDPDRDRYKYLDLHIPKDYAADTRYARIHCIYAWTLDFYRLYKDCLQDEKNTARWSEFEYTIRNNEAALICISFGELRFSGQPIEVYRKTIGSTPEFRKILDVIQYLPFYELPFSIWKREDCLRQMTYGLTNKDIKKFIVLEEGETLPSLPEGNYLVQIIG